jgi:hypothetical protein
LVHGIYCKWEFKVCEVEATAENVFPQLMSAVLPLALEESDSKGIAAPATRIPRTERVVSIPSELHVADEKGVYYVTAVPVPVTAIPNQALRT